MTVNVNDVLDRLAEMCEPGEFERTRWTGICADAVNEITAMLKKEPDNTVDRGRITAAVTALCFYRYVAISQLNRAKSVTAGDVKFDYSENACEKAEKLWIEAKKSIADLIYGGQFEFMAVNCGDDGYVF